MTQQELELPKGWVKTKLQNIVKLIVDKDHTTPKYVKENGIPLISPKDFTENSIDFSNPKLISKTEHEQICKKCEPAFGDLLFSRIGTIGKVRKVPDNKIFNILHSIVLIRPDPKIAIQAYLFYLLQTQSIQLQAKRDTKSVGTPDLGIIRIRNFDVILLPLNEQKRIASKIEELFSKIDSTKQSLEHTKLQLVQYRHSLLKSAFEGKLTEKWREKNKPTPDIQWLDYDKKKSSIMKIYNENLQGLITIPKDWYWLDIKSLSESMKNGIYKQKKFYTEDGIACLRMYNIENWSLVWKKIKRLELTPNEISEYKLEFDDILVNRVNSMELVGKSALIPKNIEECVFESKNIRLRLKTEYIKPQFAHLWLLVASKHYFYNNFQQTTGMASINQIQLGELPIPFCSMEEQEQIVSQIEQGFSLIQNSQRIVNSTLQTLETMRMSVLKQAFQGKLVPQDPNDEPASVLLERIKKEKIKIRQ